eukprot:GFUD01054935.1.p1 GENE.GFUD01054935.1~~GFUD01054935.1.p1  ORF type:complete len:418 (+),score=122.53 GFUD01054935.1:195-1448(+)
MPLPTFPNTFDLDVKPFDPTSKHLNPNVAPFEPHTTNKTTLKTNPDLSSWQVVAAEYSGKAVAFLITSDSTMQVCTSPSFNSKCSHLGLACLDWDTVNYGKGRSATPEPTFKSLHDSGVENFTDNSSEEIEKINRVAIWSAEASRHAEEWSADVTGHVAEWSEDVTSLPQWSDDATGQVWSADNNHHLEWSAGATNVWSAGQTEEYHPDGYHVTVEYHATEDGYQHPDDAGYHLDPAAGDYHQQEEDYLQQEGLEEFSPRPCYGNDPVVVYQPWVGSESWSPGMGANLAGLSLQEEVKEKSLSPVEQMDQQKIREEFKRKILSNVGGGADTEVDEDARIREEFKKQILSNLTITDNEASEDKMKEAFRKQVLSKLKEAASGFTINDICDDFTINDKCDDIKIREAFKKQILSNLDNP